jgi:hypothetical protein
MPQSEHVFDIVESSMCEISGFFFDFLFADFFFHTDNIIGVEGGKAIGRALKFNKSLQFLDLKSKLFAFAEKKKKKKKKKQKKNNKS